jgi:hypothetical protein
MCIDMHAWVDPRTPTLSKSAVTTGPSQVSITCETYIYDVYCIFYSLLLTCVQSSVVYLRQYDMMICTTESLVHICNETKVRNRSIQRVMGVKVNIALRKRTLSQKDLLWRIHLYAALCYSLMFLCWVKSNLLPFCTPDSQRTLTLNEYANEIVERATLDHYHHFHGHSRMCAWLAS